MCIVIDINSIALVFNQDSQGHQDFRPVREWIMAGRGFIIFGGTRYKKELVKAGKYLGLIIEMKRAGKAAAIRDDAVDSIEDSLRKMTKGSDCNDQHIIALLGASNCPLLCSKDIRSYKYIKDKSFYPRGMPKVRIYSSANNKDLLKPMALDILRNVA